jgi:hypothetical protein
VVGRDLFCAVKFVVGASGWSHWKQAWRSAYRLSNAHSISMTSTFVNMLKLPVTQ